MNNELYHYGVPGMKWGVKRGSKNTSSSSEGSPQKKKKFKAATGAKVAAGILAVTGGVAMTAIIAKKSHDAGYKAGASAVQKILKERRSYIGRKSAATRALRKAEKTGGSISARTAILAFAPRASTWKK